MNDRLKAVVVLIACLVCFFSGHELGRRSRQAEVDELTAGVEKATEMLHEVSHSMAVGTIVLEQMRKNENRR